MPTCESHQAETNNEAVPTVAVQAQKLENLAHNFLSGKEEDASLMAFHKELEEVQKQGPDFTKSVFEQIKQDSSGFNPHLPSVEVVDQLGCNQRIQLIPSFTEWALEQNHRQLIGSVNPLSVSTFGIEGQNHSTGQQTAHIRSVIGLPESSLTHSNY
jgi:hypothetical protein